MTLSRRHTYFVSFVQDLTRHLPVRRRRARQVSVEWRAKQIFRVCSLRANRRHATKFPTDISDIPALTGLWGAGERGTPFD